jgi:hypothetical protein
VGQALLAAIIAAAIAFVVGELIVILLARRNRELKQRYLPALITFVLLIAIYTYVVNFGAAG